MFKGTFTALITPFNEDFSVDFSAYKTLLDMQSKMDGIVVCGSTGEGTLLTTNERYEIIKFAKQYSKVPVIVGCSACSTASAIDNIKMAQDLDTDGVLVTAPYYVKPTQDGIVKHFEAISNCSNIPIIVYNIPGRVTVNIELDTLIRISQLPNIKALKDSTKNFETLSKLHIECPTFTILSGDDGTLYAGLSHGASGTVSAAANVFPDIIKSIVTNWNENKLIECKQLLPKMTEISRLISYTTNPIAIKYILSKMGKIKNILRPPLYAINDIPNMNLDFCL